VTITGAPMFEGGPSADEVLAVVGGVIGAAAPDARRLEPVQATVVRALTKAMTGFDVVVEDVEPLDSRRLVAALAGESQDFRNRIVQVIVLAELILHPIPVEVAARVEAFAVALGVDESLVRVARRYAEGHFGLAAYDLRRTGYLERWTSDMSGALHTKRALGEPFEVACDDPVLFDRWRSLEESPEGTLGRAVTDFYRARGFVYPGRPESAPPYLAQHDWVHCIGDYCSKLDGEFEVFGLIGRADPDPRGFTWIATIIGLFDTGYHDAEGNVFQADVTERWLEKPGMDLRLADAMRRGAICGKDLMAVDYFAHAHRPLVEVADVLGIPEKAPEAIAAGSTSPFDPDWKHAMSEFQHRAAAEQEAARVGTGMP
jgi:hypothetical protein